MNIILTVTIHKYGKNHSSEQRHLEINVHTKAANFS